MKWKELPELKFFLVGWILLVTTGFVTIGLTTKTELNFKGFIIGCILMTIPFFITVLICGFLQKLSEAGDKEYNEIEPISQVGYLNGVAKVENG